MPFLGYGDSNITTVTRATVDAHYDGANAKTFLINGNQHVLIGGYGTLVDSHGIALKDWVDGFLLNDSRWQSTKP